MNCSGRVDEILYVNVTRVTHVNRVYRLVMKYSCDSEWQDLLPEGHWEPATCPFSLNPFSGEKFVLLEVIIDMGSTVGSTYPIRDEYVSTKSR